MAHIIRSFALRQKKSQEGTLMEVSPIETDMPVETQGEMVFLDSPDRQDPNGFENQEDYEHWL